VLGLKWRLTFALDRDQHVPFFRPLVRRLRQDRAADSEIKAKDRCDREKIAARGAVDITAIAPATPVFLDLAHRRLERIAILPITLNHSVRPRESGDATPSLRSAMNSRRLMSDIKLAPAFACSVQSSFRQIRNCSRHIRVVDQLEAAFTAGLTGRGLRNIFGICSEGLDC